MGTVFIAAAVSITFYICLYFALRPHGPQIPTLPPDFDLDAEFSEKMSARNRTPSYAHVLLFDLLPYGAGEMSTRNLLRCLARKNNATHLTSSQLEEVPLDAQQGEIFAQTITRMGSHDVRPLIFDRYHIFVDFEKSASLPRVALAAMVSDPIERFVTHFKKSRLSAHWRPRFTELSEQDRSGRLKAVLNSEWAHKNLSACVLGDDPECVPPPGSIAPSLVSHFCGPDPTCRIVGSRTALERAKFNLETLFSVVGVVGREEETLRALDAYLPLFARGAQKLEKVLGGGPEKSTMLKPVVRKRLMRVLANDIELYRFAQRRLEIQMASLDGKNKI